jgi:hypothetical protein
MENEKFERPLPVLTPEQRFYLDAFGYVVIPNTLTSDEVGTLREALQKLKRDLQALNDPNARIRGARLRQGGAHRSYLTCLVEADPAITAYCTHPRLLGMSEELIGGEARIVEVGGIINSRDPNTYKERPDYGLHRGTDIKFGSHIQNGLYHCNFVKTLTNLTDLGPEDGGTVVIPGSHKIDVSDKTSMECAYRDPKLIHQVVAPAGSTLLFSETLIHGTGQIRSEKERMILICGYASRLFPFWDDYPMSADFLQRIPARIKPLFTGTAHWTRNPKYRTLEDPADTKTYSNIPW